MLHRILAAAFALALMTSAFRAAAQSLDTPPPVPVPSAAPVAAGIVPATIALRVTGAPAEPAFLETQIRAALDRSIRPTLQPGAGITLGTFLPWPLVPLRAGAHAFVNVSVTITAGAGTLGVSGVTTVQIDVVDTKPREPAVLFLDDDPEYLPSEGLVLRRVLTTEQAARLYYYHSDIGVPRDVDVVLTSKQRALVHLIGAASGPDQDVMSVGHVVSRDLLRYEINAEGLLAEVTPDAPFVVRHALLLQGEVVAGAVDLSVVEGGPVTLAVVATAAGGSPQPLLDGPRVPYDGHNRHGTFDLTSFGARRAEYVAGGPPVAVPLGTRSPSPRNLDPSDTGRDYGDYGVVQRITFLASNPNPTPQLMYLYARPLGGPARATFVVDGAFRELGCTRVPQPYWVATYQLAAGSRAASTTVTMTDGGSFFPVEYGVTSVPPLPYTPPVGAADGCSPAAPPSGGTARSQ